MMERDNYEEGVGGGGVVVFFFQAEDGIRDDLVTGVQTCALPICMYVCMYVRKFNGFVSNYWNL